MPTAWTATGEAAGMLMHDPPHPGACIRRQCLEPLGLTVTEAAKGPSVSRTALPMLRNGRIGVSPEMAIACPRRSAAAPKAGWRSRCRSISGTLSITGRRSGSARFAAA